MPIARFQLEDGRIARFEVPEGTTPEQAQSMMQAYFSPKESPVTQEQAMRASGPARFAAGMAEPLVGAAQLIAHGVSAIPGVKGTALDIAPATDAYWQGQAKKQDEAKEKAGVGMDVAGFAGNMLSPANALVASRGITAAKPLMRMAQGAGMGAAAGAMQPVVDGDYAASKAGQVAMGAASGGAMTGIVDKVAGPAISKLARLFRPENAEVIGARAAAHTDEAIAAALKETGIDASSVPPAELQAIRARVLDGMKSGKQLDPAAMLRKNDFEALGIDPLQGQLTRDPLQYAQEKNLRGVIPELAQHMQVQGQQIRGKIQDIAGSAADNYHGGAIINEALSGIDKAKRAGVNALYSAARESTGKDLNIPLEGLAQDFARISKDYGSAVPDGVANHFKELGLLSGKQRRVFTIEDANELSRVINDNHSNNPATNSALSRLNRAVKDAVIAADASGGPFAPAVKAAAERFSLHDAIPALEAAATGKASPDTFVNNFILNNGGKAGTDQTKRLAELLKSHSPEAFTEARNQLGEALKRAAFGENLAGDAPMASERYAQMLRKLGREKLGAFLEPVEVDALFRLGRVGAYINKTPDVAPVNTSNTTTSAIMNIPIISDLIEMIPGKGALLGAAKAATGAVKNQMAASNAMKAKIPVAKAALTPEQARLVNLLRGGAAVGGGVLGAEFVE